MQLTFVPGVVGYEPERGSGKEVFLVIVIVAGPKRSDSRAGFARGLLTLEFLHVDLNRKRRGWDDDVSEKSFIVIGALPHQGSFLPLQFLHIKSDPKRRGYGDVVTQQCLVVIVAPRMPDDSRARLAGRLFTFQFFQIKQVFKVNDLNFLTLISFFASIVVSFFLSTLLRSH